MQFHDFSRKLLVLTAVSTLTVACSNSDEEPGAAIDGDATMDTLVTAEWLSQHLGADSGLRGIMLATGAGIITPAGPFVSMPMAAVMIRSGAAEGPVVAFLTGWSLLALHRTLAWELPIVGVRITLLRYGVCLVLPVVAGLLARAVTRS